MMKLTSLAEELASSSPLFRLDGLDVSPSLLLMDTERTLPLGEDSGVEGADWDVPESNNKRLKTHTIHLIWSNAVDQICNQSHKKLWFYS